MCNPYRGLTPWLFRTRDRDPKLCRGALRLAEFDMTMQSRAGSSNQLSDAMSCLLQPGPAAYSIGDYFPDDATSGNLCDYVWSLGRILDGVLFRDLEPLKEGVVDPAGGGEV